MSHRFQKILEPGMIGPIKTRNRIIKTASGTSYMDDDQSCGDRMIAFYERLAKGGVGFLVVESCGVEYPLGIQHAHYDEEGKLIRGVQLHLDDDRFIPGFARLTDAVHKHGCPVSIQFQHAGPWNPTGLLPRTRDTCAASAMTEKELPGPGFNPPRAYTKQEIEDQIDHWASAAERAFKAGFDACEINHGTCHQGSTFLSRLWNKREDEYGTQNYENRTRFLRNCIAEAKRRCGKNFAVHCLFNIVEYNHPGATTLQEGVEMAAAVAQVADGISCRAHRYGQRQGLVHPDRILYPEAPCDLPKDLDWSRRGKGAAVPLAEAVKAKVKNIPVWAAGLLDPEMGEEYLRKGSLDFVGMTRRLLADPELPNKVREGRHEDIRWCTGCLHCLDVRNKNQKLECRINANLGKELLPEFQVRPPDKKKRVMVVGGGPSGMEAARVAAERGHSVTLYEKDAYLGGLIPVAAVVKDLETEDLNRFVAYMVTQLEKLGVQVHLKREVTAEVVKREKPDALVIAAGPDHARTNLPGAVAPKCVQAEKMHRLVKTFLRFFTSRQLQRLSRMWMPIGKSVVILGGTLHGFQLAEFLAKRGRTVTVVHNGPEKELGDRMTIDDLHYLVAWFKQNHVSVWDNAVYKEITPEGLKIAQHGRLPYLLKGENVIDTQDLIPNRKMIDRLSGLVAETHVIGSCKEPGMIVDAIQDGHKIGLVL